LALALANAGRSRPARTNPKFWAVKGTGPKLNFTCAPRAVHTQHAIIRAVSEPRLTAENLRTVYKASI
jgi:hypothetical protein